jgi:hypothetical protein
MVHYVLALPFTAGANKILKNGKNVTWPALLMQDELDFREKLALVSHSLTNWFSGSSQNCIPKSYMHAKSLTPGHNHQRDHKTCFQFWLPVLIFMFLLPNEP